MAQTAELIAERFAAWGEVPPIVSQVFGAADPAAMAAQLERFCRQHLGAGIERAEFFAASVGSVHGLRLRDGRRVVVKLHGPRTRPAFLGAVQAVQRRLATDGFPAPAPLVAPTAFGPGTAVAETLLDRGAPPDAHDPRVRRVMACELARFVARCRPLAGLGHLRDHSMVVAPGRLWPAPHDDRFDFEATAAGAEWIDAAAGAAQAIADRLDAGDRVVGHADWRAEHLRFDRGALSAVFDWDSVIVEREPVLPGGAAHGFTANFATAPSRGQRPALSESLAFIDEYEAHRGPPFSLQERQLALAALVYSMAYAARCEHSDAQLMSWGEPTAPPDSARAFVAAHAADLLGRARGRQPS